MSIVLTIIGCFQTGGLNGPLRGVKGTLFEGGLKVDGFITSPLLNTNENANSTSHSLFSGLMHISDWFPTILGLINVSDTFQSKYKLGFDGIDQSSNLKSVGLNQYYTIEDPNPINERSHILYGMYYNVDDQKFNLWRNGSFSIRNKQYKLLHTYDDILYGGWFPGNDIPRFADLDLSINTQCEQTLISGNFTVRILVFNILIELM